MIKSILQLMLSLLFVTANISAQDSELNIFGYSDLLLKNDFNQEVNGGDVDEPITFSLLKSVIIISSEFSENWDYTIQLEFSRDFSLGHDVGGEFSLFQSFFKYNHSRKLTILGGKFLTPFGKFNAIHDASPTFVTVGAPGFFDDLFKDEFHFESIPETANLGIEGRTNTFEYSGFVGNGEGSNGLNFDANDFKMFGGRMGVLTGKSLNFGFSFYRDKKMHAEEEEAEHGAEEEEEVVEVEEEEHEAEGPVDVLAYGADVRFDLGDLNIRAEAVLSSVTESIGEHDENRNERFAFISFAYHLAPKITPYVQYELYDNLGGELNFTQLSFGITFKPVFQVSIKGEVRQRRFDGDEFGNATTVQSAVSVLF